jgi:hypothetical protein
MRGNVPVRFGGGRLETCSMRNALAVYPIEEATGSSPVAPMFTMGSTFMQRASHLALQDPPFWLSFHRVDM